MRKVPARRDLEGSTLPVEFACEVQHAAKVPAQATMPFLQMQSTTVVLFALVFTEAQTGEEAHSSRSMFLSSLGAMMRPSFRKS